MRSHPMPSDINTPADPDVLMLLRMVEKALERGYPARPPDESGMKTDGQHFGAVERSRVTFRIQGVKSIAQIIEKLRARIEALGAGEPHVVTVERVRYHQVRNRLTRCGGICSRPITESH